MNISEIINQLKLWLPAVLLLIVAIFIISLFKKYFLQSRQVDVSNTRWMKQLILLSIIVTFLILILLSMPITEGMKGQLFNLLGIAITATIALSSTTFVGNTMAGFMLKEIDGIRPGDFLKVGEHFGRVSEQGLLHTEIQTEDRDLTTLPNLYLVTTPVTVVRSSGTIVSATVSLGYDVPRQKVEEYLIIAGKKAGLKEPYVQILDLGDFSITYRIAGFLDEVKYLISFRSKLRGLMLDVLHENNIEIVSPNFMNQRVFDTERTFIPKRYKNVENSGPKAPEDLIFDKADEAQSKENVKEMIKNIEVEIDEAEKQQKESENPQEWINKKERLIKRKEYLLKLLKKKEEANNT